MFAKRSVYLLLTADSCVEAVNRFRKKKLVLVNTGTLDGRTGHRDIT